MSDTDSSEYADVDALENDKDTPVSGKRKGGEPAPTYRIFAGSKIAISSAVGKLWKRRKDAAISAYEKVTDIWDTVFQYYNNNQTREQRSPRGVFKRGDATENVVFSNLNVMLPAVYSKDPDVSCTTVDDSEEPLCKTMQTLLNTLFKDKTKLNAKAKIKKAVGIGLLTNFGVICLDWTKKDDSREIAQKSLQDLTAKLAEAKNQQEADTIYGQIEALEMNMEVLKPSGPGLRNVLPFNLIIDPQAEQPDGLDGNWMIERLFVPTATLNALYTQPSTDDEPKDGGEGGRVLVYKPTHKASFNSAEGRRDDGLGMVLRAFDELDKSGHTDDERTAYINMYCTECFLVWDKLTKRTMLFQRDDWTWPLWVWDDPLNISRFFPYYIINYTMSTGGCVSVGETAYYLDQQDEINDINRKIGRMRRAVFDYFFYNSDAVDSDQIEKMVQGIRGEGVGDQKHVIGLKLGERKASDIIDSLYPQMDKYKELFNKEAILDSINRITNTSDALRGVQFKTNTNESAVNTYQESLKLSVGAKVDVVEDVVADLATSLAELCIQNYDALDVGNIIGKKQAANWQQMTLDEFRSTYNVNIVAGSMEKPNSIFKKKEATQIVQAIGQFAQAAPGATLKVILRVLEQAFTEVVIKPEDWAAIETEIAAKTGQAPQPVPGDGAPPQPGPQPAPGAPPPGPQPGPQPGNLMEAMQNLPPELKQEVVQMRAQGVPPLEIVNKIMQAVKGGGQSGAPPQQGMQQ